MWRKSNVPPGKERLILLGAEAFSVAADEVAPPASRAFSSGLPPVAVAGMFGSGTSALMNGSRVGKLRMRSAVKLKQRKSRYSDEGGKSKA